MLKKTKLSQYLHFDVGFFFFVLIKSSNHVKPVTHTYTTHKHFLSPFSFLLNYKFYEAKTGFIKTFGGCGSYILL